MSIDLKRLSAIDIHTHPQTEEFLAAMGARRKQMGDHFKSRRTPVSFAEQADLFRSHRMAAVLCNSDDETISGVPPAPNDLIGRAAVDHEDVFIPFAGIDPWKGAGAIEEIRRCHSEFGIKGIGELNPARSRDDLAQSPEHRRARQPHRDRAEGMQARVAAGVRASGAPASERSAAACVAGERRKVG